MAMKKTGVIALSAVSIMGGVAFANTMASSQTKNSDVDNVVAKNIVDNSEKKEEAKFSVNDDSDKTVEEAEEVIEVKERENLNNFLFIGDSFTYLLKDTITSNNDNVYIHAKSGSRPSYWLDKVKDMPDENEVEGVVLLIGVNGASTDENKEDVVELMNLISEKYPNTNVYVQKIFPVGTNFRVSDFNDKIDILNGIIENHVNTLDNFTRIDTTTDLVDENGYLKHADAEGLHIQSSYNDVFYGNILKAVQEAEKNM